MICPDCGREYAAWYSDTEGMHGCERCYIPPSPARQIIAGLQQRITELTASLSEAEKALAANAALIAEQLAENVALAANQDKLQTCFRAICAERNSLNDECGRRAESMRLLAQERDRLRAAIEEGPCSCRVIDIEGRMFNAPFLSMHSPDCWKREALEGKP